VPLLCRKVPNYMTCRHCCGHGPRISAALLALAPQEMLEIRSVIWNIGGSQQLSMHFSSADRSCVAYKRVVGITDFLCGARATTHLYHVLGDFPEGSIAECDVMLDRASGSISVKPAADKALPQQQVIIITRTLQFPSYRSRICYYSDLSVTSSDS
jgi:hypothetical protein